VRIEAVRSLLWLQEAVGSKRTEDPKRVEAWLAICQLRSALRENPGADLKPLWEDAIAKVEAWQASLK
jgi:hypothetical protein